MAQLPRTSSLAIFENKNGIEEGSKNWNNLPSILSMRLSEWIGALTHPKTGAFPNGISPRQLDRLAQNQIEAASKEVGSELKPIWKSNNHLGVMLWNEVKAGRVIRLHKACYVGNFNKTGDSSGPRGGIKSSITKTSETVRMNRNSSSSMPSTSKVSDPPKPAESIPEPLTHSFQCAVCKSSSDIAGALKCVECPYQTHIYCAYKSGPVPANLLKRVPAAISNWRCYECKRCHLCGGKDDSTSGLLLCDGCDSAEHMICQTPALDDIPPAPWFCSLCRTSTSTSPAAPALSPAPVLVSMSELRPVETSSPFVAASLVIDERIDAESADNKPSTAADTAPSPDCPSSQSDPDTAQPHPHPVKTTSPPLSDETPELGQQRRSSNGSSASSALLTPETKPIRTRLGKRDEDGQWTLEDQTLSFTPTRRRRRLKRIGSPISVDSPQKIARSTSSSSSREIDAKFDFGSRSKCRKDKDESDLLPFMSEDLPLLNEDDAKSVKSAKLWTVDDTSAFLQKMGYPDSAKAFKREEIDGAALLLLRRQDVLLNLGLKLGPALKTYKFVRYIQSTVRAA